MRCGKVNSVVFSFRAGDPTSTRFGWQIDRLAAEGAVVFRVVYLHHSLDSIRFLHIYSKSDKDEVSQAEIQRMLAEES